MLRGEVGSAISPSTISSLQVLPLGAQGQLAQPGLQALTGQEGGSQSDFRGKMLHSTRATAEKAIFLDTIIQNSLTGGIYSMLPLPAWMGQACLIESRWLF